MTASQAKPSQAKQGFTLVELSIVIVIIGLIISGVTAGQSLVTASRLRSVITDVQSFQSAVNAFKMQYGYLPGDLPNASSYWTCANNAANNLNCNGNGNRQIEWYAGGNGGGQANCETSRAWQHLSLSGILPNNFSHIGAGTNTDTTNSPTSRINDTLYYMSYQPSKSFSRTETALVLARASNPNAGQTTVFAADAITPIIAQSIDAKMDDGVANKGKMYGETGSGAAGGATACSAFYNNASGADYNLSGAGPCLLVWFIF